MLRLVDCDILLKMLRFAAVAAQTCGESLDKLNQTELVFVKLKQGHLREQGWAVPCTDRQDYLWGKLISNPNDTSFEVEQDAFAKMSRMQKF